MFMNRSHSGHIAVMPGRYRRGETIKRQNDSSEEPEMKIPNRVRPAALAIVALLFSACGGSGGDGSGLTGTINADGSSTVFPITQAVAEEFRRESSGVKINVGISGTGGGFKKFCAGETDIQDASRLIKSSEKQQCAKNGVEYAELKVAIDGLSVMVNPGNTFAECLTVAELKKIWEPGSKVRTWNQVRGTFPSSTIKLYGAGTDSGTFDYFTGAIVGEEGKSRSDYTASEDDNVLVQGIAGDKNALGYFGFAYYEENTAKLKLVGIDGGGGCVKPSRDTINGGTYKPLSRPLFVYVAKKSAARPEVKAFMDFYLDEGAGLVADVGYIELPAGDLAATRQVWTGFGGS
jgi:phosphate transport system substrate-binding protein